MVTNGNAGALEKGTPLLTVRFSAPGFTIEPDHSHQLAAYLTTVVNSNLSDPHPWTSVLTQVLTRLCDVVCLVNGIDSDVDLNVSNRGQLVTMMVEVPFSHYSRALFQEMARNYKKTGAHINYHSLNAQESKLVAAVVKLNEVYHTKMVVRNNELTRTTKVLFQVHL